MVTTESEMMSHDEVESPLQSEHKFKHNGFASLGRQSSIYSLTLDEFQHTLCENGKNFGSMNMYEFLTSIWTTEENQAINASHSTMTVIAAVAASSNAQAHLAVSGVSMEKRNIKKQASLPRLGSLTLPAPLCWKTVDEVWSEIYKSNGSANSHNQASSTRQLTFGEMTLEDFLIKAGVVRKPCGREGVSQPLALSQQYGMYQNGNLNIGVGYVSNPIMGLSTSAAGSDAAVGSAGIGSITMYQPVCYGGRVVNGGTGRGYSHAQPLRMTAPVSPVSPDAMCTNQVEKVVERRQRRMIKNREFAARSRARKQAELERKRKQQYLEETKNVQAKAQRAKEKLRVMRRSLSFAL